MANYCFGYMVKEYRKRNGITQEDLCDGICDVSTLSKIESGKREPYRSLAYAIMERLNMPLTVFNLSLTEAEYKRMQIESEIRNRHFSKDYNYQDLLDKYKECGPEMDLFEEQFFKAHELYIRKEELPIKERINQLIEIIRMTFPKFSTDIDLSKSIFTHNEINMIDILAEWIYVDGQKSRTINLLKGLISNFENKQQSKYYIISFYTTIANNLATYEYIEGDIEASLMYSNLGIKQCRHYNNFLLLAGLVYIKGACLCTLNINDKEGFECLKDSFCIYRQMGRKDHFENNIKDVIDMFGEAFWKKLEKYL